MDMLHLPGARLPIIKVEYDPTRSQWIGGFNRVELHRVDILAKWRLFSITCTPCGQDVKNSLTDFHIIDFMYKVLAKDMPVQAALKVQDR